MHNLVKLLLALPLAILLGAATVPPADVQTANVQTGRSVAVDQPQRYWLSDSLNRVFLQTRGDREKVGAAKDR